MSECHSWISNNFLIAEGDVSFLWQGKCVQCWKHLLQAANQTAIMYSMSNSQPSFRLGRDVWKSWWILKMMSTCTCMSMSRCTLECFQRDLVLSGIDDTFHLSAGTSLFSSCVGIWVVLSSQMWNCSMCEMAKHPTLQRHHSVYIAVSVLLMSCSEKEALSL